MIYKVIKGYTDPFSGKKTKPGEVVEIPERYKKGYMPYVEVVETAKKEPAETRTEPKPRKKRAE